MRFQMHRGLLPLGAFESVTTLASQAPACPYTRGMNPASVLILALQQSGDLAQRSFYRQYSALMLILILLCVIIVTALAFIVTRRRARRRMDAMPKKKSPPIADAWTEAGKRMDDSIAEISDD